ncbi:tetratricopeptide (TPR) repeat protein [Nocardioides thalensis]|uniref:Tetratricopeptide (TPR) repeat protein n=1 Tax=Nocardioides thalensis TaxID=1914755 RepID=A0A853C6U2_9ACTN|nr:tetratricopeptide (TPR) repeat protein [Nocardioides thalensis]
MHPSDLWDFDDPAGSEQRFRAAADDAQGPARDVLLTQVARALGLQERYDAAHALLDGLDPASSPEVAVRVLLERGRLLRSAGDPDGARTVFEEAVRRAQAVGLDELHVDALHMVALVAAPEEQVAIAEAALALARSNTDPRARDWDASLLNNVGMTHADAEDWPAALAAFEEALAARERIGDDGRTRVARWMVAWALRNLGRNDEAFEMQTALKAELEAIGEEDPYVDEELEILRSGGSTGR